MNRTLRIGTLLLCMALAACAHRPADVDYRTLAIQEPSGDAAQPVDRTKGDVVASSAMKGGLGGFAAGALICAAIVPYALPACAVTLAPTTVTTGAVASGIVGGSVTRNTELAPPELAAQLDTVASQQRLVLLLKLRASEWATKSGQPAATPVAAVGTEAAAAQPAYRLSVALADLRMVRAAAGKPTGLVLVAQASIYAAGSDTPVWTRKYRIKGTDRRTAAEWATAGSGPIEVLLDDLARSIAPVLTPRRA